MYSSAADFYSDYRVNCADSSLERLEVVIVVWEDAEMARGDAETDSSVHVLL